MQVIVDTQGNSCLLSIKNKTNYQTGELNLSNVVNDNLKWKNSDTLKVSALISIKFEEKRRTIKRIGYEFGEGWKGLSEYVLDL